MDGCDSDGGFYCPKCPKLYAKSGSGSQNSPGGPTFDGSYGVDTEDLISVPSIDFGSLCVPCAHISWVYTDGSDLTASFSLTKSIISQAT